MTDQRTAVVPALFDRVERAEMLDRAVAPVERIARRIPEGVRRSLKGSGQLGVPFHPALVHFPVGAWGAASVMDVARRPQAARSLTVLGVAAAIPAAATGLSDWADLPEGTKRIGLVHAAANSAGLVLYLGSIAARCTGHHCLGRKLGLAGLVTVFAGAGIGGDLVFRRAANVKRV